jgi:chaperonin GroES
MILKPLGDRVLIKPTLPPQMSAAGLHLSEHRKPEQLGTVVSLGEKATLQGVAVGDTVLFSWQSGQEILLDDARERYLVMREDDLLCVIGAGVTVEANELIL